MSRSPQTLTVDDRRAVASWAADCAERVLSIFEDAVPGDGRVRAAIEQTRSFAAGHLDVAEAVRRRGGRAGAAAREAPTPAAKAAAYAAEQAAAVAHMGAHALGAAGYAAKAAALAAGRDGDAAAHAEARRHVAAMTGAVAQALSLLPALGEHRSGPLGPGRLSTGRVGDAIRVIQALLADTDATGAGLHRHAVLPTLEEWLDEVRADPPLASDGPNSVTSVDEGRRDIDGCALPDRAAGRAGMGAEGEHRSA